VHGFRLDDRDGNRIGHPGGGDGLRLFEEPCGDLWASRHVLRDRGGRQRFGQPWTIVHGPCGGDRADQPRSGGVGVGLTHVDHSAEPVRPGRNIGGLTGHTGAKRRAHVVTAKAGLVGLTKALAFDLADDRITVNCVSPGLIDTRREGATPAHHADRKTIVGRLGQARDVASAVRMLCGPGATYITGETLHVNGGVFMA